MDDQVKKSLEFKFSYEGVTYTVQSFVISADSEFVLDNIEKELYVGFVYHLSFVTKPKLPEYLAENSNLLYIVQNGEVTRMGYLSGSNFVECESNIFVNTLMARILELLMMPGNTGDYQS
jgi:hypothetical protein